MSLDYQKKQIQHTSDQDSGRGKYNQLPYHASHLDSAGQGNKKKKYIIGGLVFALIIAVVVIIVVVTGGKSDDNSGGDKPGPKPPGPTPPVPPPFTPGSNPYIVETSTVVDSEDQVTGVLVYQTQQQDLKSATNLYVEEDQADKQKLGVNFTQLGLGANNQYIKRVRFAFGQSNYKTAFLSLSDDNDTSGARFEIPKMAVNKQSSAYQMRLEMDNFKFNNTPFTFSFSSSKTGQTLIDTQDQTFIMQDKFMQIDMKLPSQHIYGFGERLSDFELTEGAWTMWSHGVNRTQSSQADGGKQTFGVHPFCLVKAEGEFVGIFFRNANAQAPLITFQEDGTSVLSYITTGGNLDINFFFKGTAKQIISDYQSFIGFPTLPPYWAMGWHSASNAYDTLEAVTTNVNAYFTNKIPLEGVWLDISYMEDGVDFSVNGTTFSGLQQYAENIKTEGKKMMVVLTPGLQNGAQGNPYVSMAKQSKVLLYAMNSTDIYEAPLIHNKTVFLDWFSDNVNETWYTGLKALYEKVPFDGLWLSYNEPAIACDGCTDGTITSEPKVYSEETESKSNGYKGFTRRNGPSRMNKRRLQNKFLNKGLKLKEETLNTSWYTTWPSSQMANESTYFLPFIPQKYNLDDATIALNATHPESGYKQYDTHSLMGHMQAKRTYDVLRQAFNDTALNDTRPFIMSRSTFAGSGQYAQHWIAELKRDFTSLRQSIAAVMNFNMFGIPFTGADVCGKYAGTGDAASQQDEVCGRWYQLSTFYPFARTNRDKMDGGTKVEPYELAGDWAKMANASIWDRYKYTRFVYGCLFEASGSGQTCFDPLLFHYPTDNMTYTDIEHTFMVGDSILVAPVVESLASTTTKYEAYFPAGNWTDLDDFTTSEVKAGTTTKMSLTAKTTTVNKFLRQGRLIPVQMEGAIDSTKASLDANFQLIANRDEQGHAQGKLFIDRGDAISELSNGSYEHYEFVLTNNTLQKLVINTDNTKTGPQNITKIVLTNAGALKETDFACWTDMAGRAVTMLPTPVYYSNMTLEIIPKEGETFDPFVMQSIHFGTSKNGDLNLCSVDGSQYTLVDADKADLSKASASLTLASAAGDAVVPNLQLNVSVKANGMIQLKWNYADAKTPMRKPFEVPDDIVTLSAMEDSTAHKVADYVTLDNHGASDPNSLLTVSSDASGTKTKIFSLGAVMLGDYFNLINSMVYTDKGDNFQGIMGLAERTVDNLFLPDGVYSLWSRDVPNPVEYGTLPAANMYGVHPFYMGKASDGSWFGVYTNLASAQDWWLKNDKAAGTVNITTIAAGGLGDVWIMTGKDPNEVTMKYHEIVGKPVLTPIWALGWNQCKWGYKNVTELRAVKAGYAENDLPLDTQWTDIDYMKDYRDFTFDDNAKTFKELPQFVSELHDAGMKYIPILDAGIAQRKGGDYDAYNTGAAKGVFIKDEGGQDDFTGEVWPVNSVYPDFFKPATATWWKDQLTQFWSTLEFDGLWLDMNEASNFCNGACYEDQLAAKPLKYELPYTPTGRDLETKSIALGAKQMDGEYQQIDTHSLFGTQEVKATHEYFQEKNKRTMIIERSAFAGMGKFGSRWLGDNWSEYAYMGYSVTGVMMHNVIGIPLAGADICGFSGNTTPELCARWHVVGAFYPFSRNHNTLGSNPQEPYLFNTTYFSGSLSYTTIMRQAMRTKYSLVNYYYTELSMLHETGGSFYKPVFFEFPDDANAYQDQTDNVMLGKALKLSVNSHVQGQNSTKFYFPAGTWCNVFNVTTFANTCIKGPQFMNLSSNVYQYDVHLREGYIVPLQNATRTKLNTTKDLLNNPVDLHIHPTCNDKQECSAMGTLLNDDGEVLNYKDAQNRYSFSFTMKADTPAAPTAISLAVAVTAQTKASSKVINANDKLGSIFIYNANGDAYKLNKDMNMSVKLNSGETLALNSIWNDGSERLVFEGWKADKAMQDKLIFNDIKTIEWTSS